MAITEPEQPPPPARRILWFAGLWVAGVAVVAGAAYALKFVMGLVVGL